MNVAEARVRVLDTGKSEVGGVLFLDGEGLRYHLLCMGPDGGSRGGGGGAGTTIAAPYRVPRFYVNACIMYEDVRIMITEAYDLDPATSSEGRSILAEIMSVAEKFRDRVTIILAGYQDDIEKKLFAFNVGLASRFEVRNFG